MNSDIRRRPAFATWGTGVLVVALALSSGAQPAVAQESGPDRLQIRTRALVRLHDNFFRVGEGGEERAIHAGTVDGRALFRAGSSGQLWLYSEAGYTRYETLGGSVSVVGGIRLVGRPHAAHLRVIHLVDRPARDIGDVVRKADITRANGEYSYRVAGDWELGVEGQVARVVFDSLPGNDSDIYGVGGSLRYRGFGYRFSPEVGGLRAWRTADAPNQEYTRDYLYARLIAIPVDPLWTSVRYRFRVRDYTTEITTFNNFGRTDEGSQWTFIASLRASSRFSFTVYYDFLDMDSSVPQRIFTTQTLIAGVEVHY